MYNTNKFKNFDDLKGVFSSAYLESEKAPQNNFHIHDAYEIMLVVSNDVEVDVNDESYPIPSGSLLVFNTFDLHRIRYNGSDLYKRYVIWFKYDFLNKLEPIRQELLRCFYVRGFEKANLLVLENERIKEISELIDKLTKNNHCADTNHLLQKLLLGELLACINNEYFKKHPLISSFSKDNNSIYNAIRYIQENYSSKIDLNHLAKLCFTNKQKFNESFFQLTGLTVGQYILNCRITAAKSFLVQGISVSDVCEKAGFNNLSNFSRTFRNHVGMSPKKYAISQRSLGEN